MMMMMMMITIIIIQNGPWLDLHVGQMFFFPVYVDGSCPE